MEGEPRFPQWALNVGPTALNSSGSFAVELRSKGKGTKKNQREAMWLTLKNEEGPKE
jgi:hypothetical protein